MRRLPYDSSIVYDTPDYTYDGLYIYAGTIKEVIWRECIYSGIFDQVVPSIGLKLDKVPEIEPQPLTYDADIPYDSWYAYDGTGYCQIKFERISAPVDSNAGVAWERFEFTIIGGENDMDRVQEAHNRLVRHFGGRNKTFGNYRADGTPDANCGLTLKTWHISSIDMSKHDPEDVRIVVMFRFAYVR